MTNLTHLSLAHRDQCPHRRWGIQQRPPGCHLWSAKKTEGPFESIELLQRQARSGPWAQTTIEDACISDTFTTVRTEFNGDVRFFLCLRVHKGLCQRSIGTIGAALRLAPCDAAHPLPLIIPLCTPSMHHHFIAFSLSRSSPASKVHSLLNC